MRDATPIFLESDVVNNFSMEKPQQIEKGKKKLCEIFQKVNFLNNKKKKKFFFLDVF